MLVLNSLLFVACSGSNFFGDLEPSVAEDGASTVLNPEAELIDDPEAVDGKAAALYKTGDSVAFELGDLTSGVYALSVNARSDEYDGWAVMRLSVDGTQVGSDNLVERSSYGDDEQQFGEVYLEAGQRITAEFLNDKWGGSPDKDRNLYIDHLTLTLADENVPAPGSGGAPEPKPGGAGLKDVAGPDTLIGAVVRGVDLFPGSEFPTKNYRETFLKEFNLATVLGYPFTVMESPGVYDFTSFNKTVNWLEEAGVAQMNHLLVGPVQYYDDWFRTQAEESMSAAQLEDYMEEFISKVMTENDNGQKIEYWNVVNEPFWYPGAKDSYYVGTFWNKLGREPDQSGLTGDAKVVDSHPLWVRRAFEIADRYTDGKLELRERRVAFDQGEYGDHYDAFYQLAAHLVNAGVPLDAVGLQARAGVDVDFDWGSLTAQIKRFKALGLEVYLAEVEIPNDGTAAGSERQKEVMYQYAKAARAGGADIINFWGITDSQLGRDSDGQLFEGNPRTQTFDAKPAYDSFKQALEETR